MSHPPFDDAIANLPVAIRADAQTRLSASRIVPRHVADDWAARLQEPMESLMLRLLPIAASFARPSISDFPVGAVAQSASNDRSTGDASSGGDLYLGANMEFPGLALGATLHAEQAAVNNAWLSGASGIAALAVTAPPCGHCRQFLNELDRPSEVAILWPACSRGDDGDQDSTTMKTVRMSLAKLLPLPFGPQNLGKTDRLMRPKSHNLKVQTHDDLATAALGAADVSHCPYTGNAAGVALQTSDTRVIAGRYAENAAFNPSLSPMISALSQMSLDLPLSNDSRLSITDAVLVERPTTVSQYRLAADILGVVAPNVVLRHILAPVGRD